MFRSRHSIEHTNRVKHIRTFLITTHFRYYIKILIFHTCAIRDVILHKIKADKTRLFAVTVFRLCLPIVRELI